MLPLGEILLLLVLVVVGRGRGHPGLLHEIGGGHLAQLAGKVQENKLFRHMFGERHVGKINFPAIIRYI